MDPGSSVHIRYHDKPFARYHRVVADLVLRYTPSGGRVLDLGCGLGHVLDVVTYAEDEVRIFSARFSRRFAALANFEIALARWAPWWSFSNIAVVRASGPQPAEAG